MADPLLLGLEIGGTKLQLGVGRGDGTILALERLKVEPAQGAAGIRAQIRSALDPLLARAGAQRTDLAAAGIGFGGPVDAERGTVIKSNQITGWEQFALVAWMRQELGITPVSLQNDADTAGLGEARFGAGRGLSPMVYVTIGSGIGGGLICAGRIYRGAGQGAMEIGHLWTAGPDPSGTEARTLEQVASGWSIGQAGRDLLARRRDLSSPLSSLAGGEPARITAAMVAEAAAGGDAEAREILHRGARAVARALAHVVTLLAPRRIILGGGVSLIRDEFWLNPIRVELEARVFPPFRGKYDLVHAALGEQVVVHGALALAAEATAARG